eukprot:2079133-Prorocentrum_lima.AAC.1
MGATSGYQLLTYELASIVRLDPDNLYAPYSSPCSKCWQHVNELDNFLGGIRLRFDWCHPGN